MFLLVSFESRWRRERARGGVDLSCRSEPGSYCMSQRFELHIRSTHVLGYVRGGTAVKMLTWKVKVSGAETNEAHARFLSFPEEQGETFGEPGTDHGSSSKLGGPSLPANFAWPETVKYIIPLNLKNCKSYFEEALGQYMEYF